MRRKFIIWLVLLLGILASELSFSAERAGNFKLRGVDGKTYELKEVAKSAKLILLNFWEVNCKPCQKEMPQIVRIYKTFEPAGLRLILVSRDTELTLSRVEPFVSSQKWDFPVLLDPELKVSQLYNVKFSPVNFLITSKGEIILRLDGYTPGNEAEIEKNVIEALGLSEEEVKKLKQDYEKSSAEPGASSDEEENGASDEGLSHEEHHK